MISFFNILVKLTDHKDINLGFAWQKYKACLEAIKICNVLWESKQFRDIFDRKPTQADIIDIFKGKTQWHLTYAKAFSKLSDYPDMVSWLENSNDRLSDIELWGVEKSAYGFADLLEWLGNDGIGINQKEKGKGKEKKKEKRKGKGKEKENEGKEEKEKEK